MLLSKEWELSGVFNSISSEQKWWPGLLPRLDEMHRFPENDNSKKPAKRKGYVKHKRKCIGKDKETKYTKNGQDDRDLKIGRW